MSMIERSFFNSTIYNAVYILQGPSPLINIKKRPESKKEMMKKSEVMYEIARAYFEVSRRDPVSTC